MHYIYFTPKRVIKYCNLLTNPITCIFIIVNKLTFKIDFITPMYKFLLIMLFKSRSSKIKVPTA